MFAYGPNIRLWSNASRTPNSIFFEAYIEIWVRVTEKVPFLYFFLTPSPYERWTMHFKIMPKRDYIGNLN